jgi:plasmid rolling circle replication initiator protein Rep
LIIKALLAASDFPKSRQDKGFTRRACQQPKTSGRVIGNHTQFNTRGFMSQSAIAMCNISCSDSSIPTQTEQDATLFLSDVSKKDKPWDIHKNYSLGAAQYYLDGSKEEQTDWKNSFKSYAQRIKSCSHFLQFALVEEGLKLNLANFCRVRNCPICQWRRSMKWKAKAYELLPKVAEVYPKHRWIFLTLTIKNPPIYELRAAITEMHNSFKKMTKRKDFPAIGWIKATEVTRSYRITEIENDEVSDTFDVDGSEELKRFAKAYVEDGFKRGQVLIDGLNEAHPHFHCLLLVPSTYFAGRSYLSAAKWTELWKSCLGVDYTPILHVETVKGKPEQAIPEVLKYSVKDNDLVADRRWFLEYTMQVHKLRFVEVGGELKKIMRGFEKADEGDLIHIDESDKFDKDEEEVLNFIKFAFDLGKRRYRAYE